MNNQKGIASSLGIIIVIAIGIIAIGGVLAYQYLWAPKEEVEKEEIEEKEETPKDETADWKTYRNEEIGFEIMYPKSVNIIEHKESVFFEFPDVKPGLDRFLEVIIPEDIVCSKDKKWMQEHSETKVSINDIDFYKNSYISGGTETAGYVISYLTVMKNGKCLHVNFNFSGSKYVQPTFDEVFDLEIDVEIFNEVFSTFRFIEIKDKTIDLTELEQSCIGSGGTVTTIMCCKNVDDFPNTYPLEGCYCMSGYDYEIKICDCGDDRYFDSQKGCFFEGIKVFLKPSEEMPSNKTEYKRGETVIIVLKNNLDESIFTASSVDEGDSINASNFGFSYSYIPANILEEKLADGSWQQISFFPSKYYPTIGEYTKIKSGASVKFVWDQKEFTAEPPDEFYLVDTGTFRAKFSYIEESKALELGFDAFAKNENFTIIYSDEFTIIAEDETID